MKNKIYQLTLTILILISGGSLMAQQCGTFDYENYLNTRFPGYSNSLEQTRQYSSNAAEKLYKASNDTVYRIPVVFHIVWNTPEQNIHDSLIFSQMKALNESFRHTHKDTGKVRSTFKPVAGDSKIEFYLATEDPDGKPTNGIDRFKTTKSDFGETNFFGEGVKSSFDKGVDAWNTEKYLNIWVCKFTYNGTIAITAYAFPPTNAQFWSSNNFTSSNLQGVVVNYQYVGLGNPNTQDASSMKERTLVHEVGHFLGLRHIWADKNNICSGADDGIKDTPLCKTANRNCGGTVNSCNEGTGDKPDMTENYMDYSPYPCTKMFTVGQTNLMRYNLLNLRSKLYKLETTTPPPVKPVYNKISVSSNPVKGDMKITFNNKGDYQILIIDYIGQKVLSEPFTVGDTYEYTKSLNLAPGFYYLSIISNYNAVHQQPIFVE